MTWEGASGLIMEVWGKNMGLALVRVVQLAAFCLIIGSSGAFAQCANDNLTRVTGKRECIAIRTFGSATDAGPTRLVVFIHGDQSDQGPVSGMINLARDLAVPAGTVKVAVLRPGYFDRESNKSTGENFGRVDSYTPANIDEIAVGIVSLKAYYKPVRTVIVGHSGGAAFAGVMIGRHPGIAEAALLLSCPCDIGAWRGNGGRPWMRSLSPDAFAKNVPSGTRVLALTGANDSNTFGSLAEDYVKSLRKRGIVAEYRSLPGIDHNGTVSQQIVAGPVGELLN